MTNLNHKTIVKKAHRKGDKQGISSDQAALESITKKYKGKEKLIR